MSLSAVRDAVQIPPASSRAHGGAGKGWDCFRRSHMAECCWRARTPLPTSSGGDADLRGYRRPGAVAMSATSGAAAWRHGGLPPGGPEKLSAGGQRGNHRDDAEWVSSRLTASWLFDISDQVAQLALRVPSRGHPEKDLRRGGIPKKYYRFNDQYAPLARAAMWRPWCTKLGSPASTVRAVLRADRAVGLWNTLLGGGRACGAPARGLGARDTLPEAAMPLYGHEMDTTLPQGGGFPAAGRQRTSWAWRPHRPGAPTVKRWG
jgi:hypothetical protein